MIPMSEVNEDENAQEWERIKNWVGGANSGKKHPLSQEHERQQRRIPQFDQGGDVPAIEGLSDDTLKMLEPQGAGTLVPSMRQNAQPPIAPVPPPVPQAVQPPTAPATPAQPPVAAPTDQNFKDQAVNELGGISPEMIAYVNSKTMKPTGGELAGMGLAGLGDAIASIGERNPGAMKNAQAEIQAQREAGQKLPERMMAAGKEHHALSQEFQINDPSSNFSKTMQKAYGSTLKNMPGGQSLTDKQIALMPAAVINDVLSKKVDLAKAIAEVTASANYRAAELGIQQQGQNTRQQEANQSEQKLEAEHPFQSALGILPKASSGKPSHGVPDLGDTFNGEKVIGVKKIQ